MRELDDTTACFNQESKLSKAGKPKGCTRRMNTYDDEEMIIDYDPLTLKRFKKE